MFAVRAVAGCVPCLVVMPWRIVRCAFVLVVLCCVLFVVDVGVAALVCCVLLLYAFFVFIDAYCVLFC